MTKPKEWAFRLWFRACASQNPALTIQRAFEEQTRELRESLAELRKWQAPSGQDPEIDAALARADRALATRQPTPTEGSSDDQ